MGILDRFEDIPTYQKYAIAKSSAVGLTLEDEQQRDLGGQFGEYHKLVATFQVNYRHAVYDDRDQTDRARYEAKRIALTAINHQIHGPVLSHLASLKHAIHMGDDERAMMIIGVIENELKE